MNKKTNDSTWLNETTKQKTTIGNIHIWPIFSELRCVYAWKLVLFIYVHYSPIET